MTKLSDLNPNKKNPRKIDEKRLDQLQDDLLELGDLSGIVFNSKLDTLVGGHQRKKVFDRIKSEVVITKTLDKPDFQGTTKLGKVIVNGAEYSYREVSWDEKTHDKAMLKANDNAGSWDDDIRRKHWSDEQMEDWGIGEDCWVANIDYSLLDDEEIESIHKDMISNVKSAIQIEFNAEDFEEAKKIVLDCRKKNIYMGKYIMESLKNALNEI